MDRVAVVARLAPREAGREMVVAGGDGNRTPSSLVQRHSRNYLLGYRWSRLLYSCCLLLSCPFGSAAGSLTAPRDVGCDDRNMRDRNIVGWTVKALIEVGPLERRRTVRRAGRIGTRPRRNRRIERFLRERRSSVGLAAADVWVQESRPRSQQKTVRCFAGCPLYQYQCRRCCWIMT